MGLARTAWFLRRNLFDQPDLVELSGAAVVVGDEQNAVNIYDLIDIAFGILQYVRNACLHLQPSAGPL